MLLELTVAEQRFNAVMEVLRDGLTVIEVAERYGVSRQAVHGWLRRYRTGGLEALADRSHRPDSCPHQMPAEVEARLCELRRHHPGWGQRRLAHELARDGVDPPPGLTSIYRALVRNGLIQPRSRRRAKASYRRWERARPMELWQLDVMGGIWLTDGRELKAVTGIDDHSRFCVAAGLVERANARASAGSSPRPWPATASPRSSSPTTARSSPAASAPTQRGAVRPHLPRARDHPPAHRRPLPDHHRQDRTVPQDPAGRAAHRPPLRLPGPGPTGAGRLGGRLQHPAAPTRPSPCCPGPALPATDGRGDPGPSRSRPASPLTVGPTEVTRRVSASGLIGVCYQQVSAGRHLAGQVVTVRLHPTVLQVFFAGQLIRTVPRRSTKEVVQLRAHRPHQPRRRPTTN